MPLFAIPGGPDLGALGKSALRFLDFLKSAKQTVFQTLPINPTDEKGSPYAGRSAFAGEPLYLDLEELRDEGLIAAVLEEESAYSSRKRSRTWARDVVDYSRALERRKPLWNEAFQNYRDKKGGKKFRDQEERFRTENAFWLDDFALFQTAAERFETFKWAKWPKEIRRRDPDALKRFAKRTPTPTNAPSFCNSFSIPSGETSKNNVEKGASSSLATYPSTSGKKAPTSGPIRTSSWSTATAESSAKRDPLRTTIIPTVSGGVRRRIDGRAILRRISTGGKNA